MLFLLKLKTNLNNYVFQASDQCPTNLLPKYENVQNTETPSKHATNVADKSSSVLNLEL